MQDFVPLGTGNSRYLKSIANFLSVYPTYESMVAALVAGTLPVDFNGINDAGISQKGTPLNKDSLLKGATAAMFGLGADAVPNDVLALIKQMIDSNYSELSSLAKSKAKIVVGSYAGTNVNANSITFPALPKFVYITGPSDDFKNAFITVVNGKASYAFESASSLYTYTPKISGTKISWEARSNPYQAMNYTGNYQWIAIY